MKILAVYGAGNKSLEVERIVSKYCSGVECNYLIENKQFNKIGSSMASKGNDQRKLQVISTNTCKDYYVNNKISGVVFPTSYHLFDWEEIVAECEKMGIGRDKVYAVPIDILRKDALEKGDIDRILVPYDDLEQLYHLDIHIVDECNMKCKGCAHFAPLVKNDVYMTAEKIHEHMTYLKKLVPNINEIAILGGEPLLNPELDRIINVISDIYPYTEKVIVTNGILLTQLSEACLEAIRRNNIKISISMYPMFKRNLERWLDFFRQQNLSYVITDCTKFERRLWKKPVFDGNEITKYCGHVLCMKDRHIARCPMIAFIDYYNQYFGKKFPEDGKVNIYDFSDGKELIKALNQARGLCNYCCARDHCLKEWENATAETIKEDDWFLDMPNLCCEGETYEVD